MNLTSPSPGIGPSRPNLSDSIFRKEQRVTWGTENMFWIPAEYRPKCTAVHGNVIALGYRSGLVLIMGFDLQVSQTSSPPAPIQYSELFKVDVGLMSL